MENNKEETYFIYSNLGQEFPDRKFIKAANVYELTSEVAKFITEKMQAGINPETNSFCLSLWKLDENGDLGQKPVFEYNCTECSNLSVETEQLLNCLEAEYKRVKEGREKKLYRLTAWHGIGTAPTEYLFRASSFEEISAETKKFILEKTGPEHYHILLAEIAYEGQFWGDELFRYQLDGGNLKKNLDSVMAALDVQLHPEKTAEAQRALENSILSKLSPNSKLIVDASFNWADEVDVGAMCVLTKEKFKRYFDFVISLPRKWSFEFWFGSNQFIELSKEDLLDMLVKAKEITFAELAVLKKFVPDDCYLPYIFDRAIEDFEEGEYEDENEEE